MGFEVETHIPDCSYWAQWTLHLHQKPSYSKNTIIPCQGYHSWTSHWVLEHWHPIWQSQSLYQSSIQFTYNSTHWYSKLMFLLHFILFIPLHQLCFSPTLQLSAYFHPCYEHIPNGTRRISYLSTSLTSIPHQALLDRHCTHITWKSGTTLEALQEATH